MSRSSRYRERLSPENVDRILGDGWEVIVDGADNFPTRYLLNDASVWHGVPVVHGSIFRFEGQATVFAPGSGPCYRCLFPQPPPPELAPSCAEGGVLGVLPGRDRLDPGRGGAEARPRDRRAARRATAPVTTRSRARSTEVAVRRDPACPVCGDAPTITEYVDYVEFCGSFRLRLRRDARALEHALEEAPNEACGLVLLRDGEPSATSGAGTRSLRRTAFGWRSTPEVWFLEDEGYELAVFHSHGASRAATLAGRPRARGALGMTRPWLILRADTAGAGRVADQGRSGGRGCRCVAPSSSAPASSAARSPSGWQAADGR